MTWNYFLLWVGYLCLLVAVGLVFRQRVKTLEDFFLASRLVPAGLLTFTLTASWVGATSVFVTTDEAYYHGFSALWLVGIPAWLTVVIMAIGLAGPIRSWAGWPLLDLLESRYGRVVREISNLLILWYMILLAASQLVALGNFLQVFIPQNYILSLSLGLAAVLIYTSLGGLFSVVITDLLQSFFLFSGLLALFFFLLTQENQLANSPPLGLADFALSSLFVNFSHNGLAALSFTLAWLVSPIAWQRVQAARSNREAKKGLWLTAGAFTLIYPLIALIGILSRSKLAVSLDNLPLMAKIVSLSSLSSWLRSLLFIAIVAAILSTLDTAINAAALFFSREISRQSLSEASSRQLRVSRWATIIIGLAAFFIATRFRSILQTIGLASEIMAEGLFIPVVATLFFRPKAKLAGLLSLSAGALFSLGSFLTAAKIFSWPFPPWPAGLPYGIGFSVLGWIWGWLVAKISRGRLR